MEQRQDILINRFFTGYTSAATSVSIQSNLQYENKYYFNNSGESLEIVDFSNVRSFLANGNNQKIVQTYYAFLSSSPLMNSALLVDPYTAQFVPTAEFKSIYYDDERLAKSFNNFYNTSILRGLDSNYSSNPNVFNTSIRNQLLPGTDFVFTAQSVSHNYYFWSSAAPSNPAYSPIKLPFANAVLDIYDGDRDTSIEERIVEIPSDNENYFINIILTKRFTQTARMAFEICSNVIYKVLNTPVIFSQSLTDRARYNDFLESSQKNAPNGIDKTPIKSIEYIQTLNSSEVFVAAESNRGGDFLELERENQIITAKTLIQCFVDPNFKTNENEMWSDSIFKPTNSLVIGEIEELQIAEELQMVEKPQIVGTEILQTPELERPTQITDIQINEPSNMPTEEQAEEDNSETEPDGSPQTHPDPTETEDGWQ